jgi:hypothetical protein
MLISCCAPNSSITCNSRLQRKLSNKLAAACVGEKYEIYHLREEYNGEHHRMVRRVIGILDDVN